jgi:uncharacterized protein (TIGR03437 family)
MLVIVALASAKPSPFFSGVGTPGLYRFNLRLPARLGAGDQSVLAKINGASS